MADKKFEAILTLLVPQVINLICENYPLDEMTASKEFYESKVYSLLEQEDTKLWHFSPLTPVSYTHLDVYKRQMPRCSVKSASTRTFAMLHCHAPFVC